MCVIGQGKGKAKDNGIYCRKRALGMCCINARYESCIANICPYHVFTTDGIPTLVRVIKAYSEKEDYTGKNKYKIVLKKRIIPAFQEIIKEILKEMTEKDRKGLKKLITEALNE